MKMKQFVVFGVLAAFLVGCGEELTTPDLQTKIPVMPRVPLGADGVSLAVAGTGLNVLPATLDVTVPVVDAADILEATLYWNGGSADPAGDPTVLIDGVERTFELVVPAFQAGGTLAFFYKLDVTALVEPGANSFTIDGIDIGANGMGIAVIYRDSESEYSEIHTLDLAEYFYWDDPNPALHNGEVHNFPFDPADAAREGRLVIMIGDCREERADTIWWDASAGSGAPAELIGGPFPSLVNVLDQSDGPQWDTFVQNGIPIPAGAGHFAFQIESPIPGNGDSGLMSFAAFCVPDIPPPPPGCFWTIGFWKHQFNVALGDKPGHQHVSDGELRDLLDAVYANTAVDYDLDGNEEISFREADTALDLHGSQSMCTRARQQFLATLLNYAVNELDGSIMVDTDYDGVPDMELGDALAAIEDGILGGDCGHAKDMADSINNMPECDDVW